MPEIPPRLRQLPSPILAKFVYLLKLLLLLRRWNCSTKLTIERMGKIHDGREFVDAAELARDQEMGLSGTVEPTVERKAVPEMESAMKNEYAEGTGFVSFDVRYECDGGSRGCE